jgi:hypothetical protein
MNIVYRDLKVRDIWQGGHTAGARVAGTGAGALVCDAKCRGGSAGSEPQLSGITRCPAVRPIARAAVCCTSHTCGKPTTASGLPAACVALRVSRHASVCASLPSICFFFLSPFRSPPSRRSPRTCSLTARAT